MSADCRTDAATRGVSAYAMIDLEAIAANLRSVAEQVGPASMMAIVKADAYGHGLIQVAQTALEAGADRLGIAQLSEALQARQLGITAPILTWLYVPEAPIEQALRAGLTLTVSSDWQLAAIADAACATGAPATIHLKVDTGLGRGGAAHDRWSQLVAMAAAGQAEGILDIEGIWSHFACADHPGHPSIAGQQTAYREALGIASQAGITPRIRHLANSAAALTNPGAHYDLVRVGLAMYGLSPIPQIATSEELQLREAMRVIARLAGVKPVPSGQGISYGHSYTTSEPTQIGLIPMGYADGIPWNGGNVGPVTVARRGMSVAGRVCMDQFVIDLGAHSNARPGDEVVIFGVGAAGEPTAQDWAAATGTINYELVTRVGARVPRIYQGGAERPQTWPH